MSDQYLDRYARDYHPGDILFREGDPGDVMYVIQSGEVEIRRQIGERDRVLAVLPAGEFFGEMAIVNARPRSATAVVRSPARLLVIDSRIFEAMLRGRIEIAVRMIKTMAGRLESANKQVEILLLQDSNHRVVQCLRHLAEDQGAPAGNPAAIFIPIEPGALATRVALPVAQVTEVIERLRSAQLVVHAAEAGIDEPGYVIPEVGRLLEFLEFLELKERFGRV